HDLCVRCALLLERGLPVPSLGLRSERVLCVGWAYLRSESAAPRPGNCECAVSASATRLLPRRSGWSYWAADAWRDRGLSARSRALHHIHCRSANTSIARHVIARTNPTISQKAAANHFDGGFFLGSSSITSATDQPFLELPE